MPAWARLSSSLGQHGSNRTNVGDYTGVNTFSQRHYPADAEQYWAESRVLEIDPAYVDVAVCRCQK
jgi:hypothetical protein